MCLKKVEPKRKERYHDIESDIMARKFIQEKSNDYKTGYNNAINEVLNLDLLKGSHSKLENARFRLLKKILMEMKKE